MADIRQGHPADDHAGDHQRRAAQLCARPRRVRFDCGGGALNFSTRSGGAEFRGTLFEYLRDDALDARSFFVNANPNGVKEKLRFSQFGGNLGGPVYPPSFGKNGKLFSKSKDLFFFFNYEALRISQTRRQPSTVPSVKRLSRRASLARVRAWPSRATSFPKH